MLFLLFLKPKLNLTEKTHAFPAFPAFAEVGASMPFKYSAFTIGIPEKAGKAGKALVFSVKLFIVTYNWRKSMVFSVFVAYQKLKHWSLSEFLSSRILRQSLFQLFCVLFGFRATCTSTQVSQPSVAYYPTTTTYYYY